MAQQGGTYRISTGNDAHKSTRSSLRASIYENNNFGDGQDSVAEGKAESQSSNAIDVARQSNISVSPHDNNRDSRQWEVLPHPQAEEYTEEPLGMAGGISSQFDFQFGWGSWKFSLFNWDLNVNRAKDRKDRKD
ncbi:hypothetical protein DPSP01_010431 [Paraphaeosphaeria sporulosa]